MGERTFWLRIPTARLSGSLGLLCRVSWLQAAAYSTTEVKFVTDEK